MKVIGRDKLVIFCEHHANCRDWIRNWIADAEGSLWKSPHEIKQRYSSASFLSDNTVIFNVKGNNYRLEVQIAYRTSVVFIKWIGTHAEYTKKYS
jgi:mRNA interferase HigB